MANTSVDEWLRSLGLLNYVQAFIDNGYDDLDICKQIGDEDLDAIGVINAKDRKDILASVQSLKDQGVNAVYFQLEAQVEPTIPRYGGQTDREKYRRDELIDKMKALLADDNCVLPENNPNIEHDPLDDLAQYYADQLYTYFQDVKEVLEYLRDGESNEGVEHKQHGSPALPMKKNAKLLQESKGLSKSLSSLDANSVKTKGQKSPKHGFSRLFSGKKKNYVVQPPPKISGPAETAIITSNVQMSDDDRKSLMLQVKHGDISMDEALNTFNSYERTHVPKDNEKDKTNEKKEGKKKKGGLFNRSSFKRRSSGHSSELLAADIQLGERDRIELMRKIKNKEITTEEAWDQLRRFGSKRESKSKSPKMTRKGSAKSPKTRDSRISASSVQLCSSTFYTEGEADISQSTSNISLLTGSDSSPDSTPGLPRKLDLRESSAEQLGLRGSIEFDSKNAGNYSTPRQGPPVLSKRTPSPKAGTDLRRVVSDKRAASREQVETKRRSTLSNVESNRSSNSSLNGSMESLNRQSPTLPPKKPPKGSLDNKTQRSGNNELEGKKPPIPAKPVLPPKPGVPAKPPKPPVKPQRITAPVEKSNTLPKKVPLVSLANGLSNENVNTAGIRTTVEVTSEEGVTSQQERPKIQPPRPSPQTRVSRHKPSGTKLLEMIEEKLDKEGIDLVQEPYSNQDGAWGVPMALIDRYSLELQSTMREVTKEMDHIRIEKLNHVKKKATPCDLSTLRFAPDVVGKLSSVVDWLTSLGLPMYIDSLIEEGFDDMDIIPYLSQEHLNFAGITKPEHVDRLVRSLENMAPNSEAYNGD